MRPWEEAWLPSTHDADEDLPVWEVNSEQRPHEVVTDLVAKDDAQLIAAAPEMARALIEIRNLVDGDGTHRHVRRLGHIPEDVWQRMSAALANAGVKP